MRYRTKAWVGLGLYVATVEALAPPGELLSNAFDEWLKQRFTRILAFLGVLATGGHLLNLVPEKYDLFHWIGELFNLPSDMKKRRYAKSTEGIR